MGIGDELMVAGEAQRRAAGAPRKYRVLDKRNAPQWNAIWDGHPNIARPGERYDEDLGRVNGKRPYMLDVKPDRYIFQAYEPVPALIRLTARAGQMKTKAAGHVLVNPHIKSSASPNKDWGFDRWQRLVELLPDVPWLQVVEPGRKSLLGVKRLHTVDFMDAVGALSGASAAVLQEGGLHHAAAAVGCPAVVIRGGFISPRVTGYAGQVDLYVESEDWPLGCGMRVPCAHCAAAMAGIAPAAVAGAVMALVERKAAV